MTVQLYLRQPPQPTAESRQLTLWCVTMAPFDSEPGETLPMALEPDMGILRLCCEDFFPGFESVDPARENDKAKSRGKAG